MKKFLSLFCALAIVLSASAAPLNLSKRVGAKQKIEAQKAPRLINAQNVIKPVLRAPQAKAAEGLVSGTYFTTGGKFYAASNSSWQDATADMPSIEVTVDGSNISIAGLAYWFKEGAINGTIDGNTITFASGQLVGTDEYGDEFLVGSNDGETVADIVFVWDPTAKTLTASTKFILESGSATEVSPYCYWSNPVFAAEEPVAPEAVVLPDGAELVEYALTYTDYNGKAASGTAAVAIVGNDVYFQGFSSYIPNALIKGTKDGNTITFPANQFLGNYGSSYTSYFIQEAVFTYDEANDTYSATGNVYSLLNGQYIDIYAVNPVLKGIVEKAAMPADPAITALTNGNYGYYITFNVPNVDVDGNGLVASKLFYEIFTDVEKEIQPLTFTSATHVKLTEDLTVIPFGFTENYDFYTTQIYLNDLYSSTWNKIGIRSIYTGGGETNETEIQWFDIKDYAAEPTGEEVNIFFNVPMAIPQYYTDGYWELSTKSQAGDTAAYFVYLHENPASPAGTFSVEDLDAESSALAINDAKINFQSGEFTVTEDDERIDLAGDMLGNDGILYHIKMFFIKPKAEQKETITADNLTIDTSLFSWLGFATVEASDENNAVDLNINIKGLGAEMAGDYVAGTDFNGKITPTDGEAVEIYSGTVTITVAESGDINLSGAVVCTNNVEYTLDLTYIKPEPQTFDVTIASAVGEYQESYGRVKYTLDSEDGNYRFFFAIYLEEGQEDVELGKAYDFENDMKGLMSASYGMLLDGSYTYYDYATVSFVKTVVDKHEHIDVVILDVDGNTWNLSYIGEEEIAEAIDNLDAAAKATKRLENGQLIIEKNNVRYSVFGAVIR